MFRFVILGAFALVSPAMAEADPVLDVARGWINCVEKYPSPTERVNCYDALTPQITKMLKEAAKNTSSCKIEDWKYSRKAGSAYLNGSTTCASGRLDYRLYDGEKFLASGFTFIKGYAFQTYADVPNLPNMGIKYTIQPGR